MGYGFYSHEAHEALTRGRGDLPRQEVFKQRSCHPLMNPKGVRVRESRDSAEHPSSLGIVFALDVTGSMGHIPDLLARTELPKFMQILGTCGVADPQVLFVAVGDATSDAAPLQVGQFETTAELMDQWLTWSYLEGGGGAGDRESYELALYFLAEHTDMDAWVKRKKRGYVFMTGDELPYPAVSKHAIESVIGDRVDEDIPTAEVVSALSETFHPFFLIPDPGRAKRCEKAWRKLLGDHVLVLESAEDTCYVAAGAVALTEKVVADVDTLAKMLVDSGVDTTRVRAIVKALTPYAATLDKDGVPALRDGAPLVPPPSGKSLWKRLWNKDA